MSAAPVRVADEARRRLRVQDGADRARSADAIVARYNRDHAVARLQSGESVILEEFVAEDGRPGARWSTVRAFREWNRPRRAEVDHWLAAAGRREFPAGLVFEPGAEVAGAYNLWRGWAVIPDPDPIPAGRCARFLDHLFENVCGCNDALFAFVLAWLAQLVQEPREKPGTSLFLRGRPGTGKTVVGRALRRLLGPHYLLVNDPRFVVGRFNAHLENLLLLHADEAFFAGDPAAVGRLKDLVTGDRQLIERKGMEPVAVANYVRILGTTNNEWVVPADANERRFAVLDVSDARRQDHTYFAALERELDHGGAAALLAYLLAYEIGDVNLRTVPETDALAEQKQRSLAPEPAWWLDVLRAGELPPDRLRRPGVCECQALTDHYLEHAKGRGVTRRAAEVVLGTFLRRQVPGLRRVRSAPLGVERVRPWVYEFPPLAECRAHAPGGAAPWDDPTAAWEAPSA